MLAEGMKCFPLVLLAMTSSFLHAGDFRAWTEASSKRTIEGTITDKKSDSSAAKIVTKEDRTVWLEASKLTPGDQDFIKKWISPGGRLSAKVIASGKGWKELKVSYQSGASPLNVEGHDVWPDRRKGPIRKAIKAGESGEFSYKAHNEYRVIAFSEGKEVDRETDKRKTGL
jgi:hypothetical protein